MSYLLLYWDPGISPNAVFRLERATKVLELTYLGKYFACVNAN